MSKIYKLRKEDYYAKIYQFHFSYSPFTADYIIHKCSCSKGITET